ncbi:KPN_02809 family neutral zinc metallopeptidase [Zavarzinia sp. CC-PAN008]|uniref:KPN_02809 family neutral zinc metallopeptidase n=1 Tax=Zavarzinia sp. CC-PAN008 TaxID=3243332 RepID=UPI003F747C48
MRWSGRRESSNVEDRRGIRVTRGGGLMGGGIGGIAILLIGLYLGVDPALLMDLTGGGGQVSQTQGQVPPGQEEAKRFVSVVLADTEDTWNGIFSQNGRQYAEPRMVLFTGAVQSACGLADSAVGPFYCPADQQVYLDLDFFGELSQRFGAPGDFAQAYVIAHEVGHHVQTLLGLSGRQAQARSGLPDQGAEGFSVRVELQADCFAGIWARTADRSRGVIEPGDIEEALGAASAIGDDTLQRRGQGTVVPDAFTHGTSEQRVRWFRRGFEQGTVGACDTFGAARL